MFMKYIFIILISAITTVLSAQPLCRIETRYELFGNRRPTFYDTLRFHSSSTSKYLNGVDFDVSHFVKKYIQETMHYNGITIQGSVYRGGRYTDDASGKDFGHGIFWYRVVNETDAPLELTISFDAFTMRPAPESFLKLFLPSDTMTLAKAMLYNYGVDVKSFLDVSFNDPTMLQRTIHPNEEFLFNIGMLYPLSDGFNFTRTELVLNGQDLFYKIKGTDPQ